MVLVTLTGDSIPKVLQGRKVGTTRRPTDHWLRVVRKLERGEGADAQLWAGSPRNKGRLLWSAKIVRATLQHGRSYDGEMVLKDGFQQKSELAVRLAEHYNGPWTSQRDADAWFDRELWVYIEWENPPRVEVRGEQLVEVPITA